MPQLDKVTFFAQVTWSLASYMFLYFLFSVHIGPAVGRVLKVRSKINLGGSPVEKQQATSVFISSVSSLINASSQTPMLFLKSSSTATKAAISSAVARLGE